MSPETHRQEHWPRRFTEWHSFRYCLTCLHSIGINAAGNYCTPAQYSEAWRKINGGEHKG